MDDQPVPSASEPEPQPEPQPTPQPATVSTEPATAPVSTHQQATVTLDRRVAMVGAAAALVIVAGAAGFALGRTTADDGHEVRVPVIGFNEQMRGPNGGVTGQPPGPWWNNGQNQSGPGA